MQPGAHRGAGSPLGIGSDARRSTLDARRSTTQSHDDDTPSFAHARRRYDETTICSMIASLCLEFMPNVRVCSLNHDEERLYVTAERSRSSLLRRAVPARGPSASSQQRAASSEQRALATRGPSRDLATSCRSPASSPLSPLTTKKQIHENPFLYIVQATPSPSRTS